MGLISTFIFGLVAGIVAKMLMPGRDPGGFIITAIIGIVGAFIGKYLSGMLGGGTNELMNWTWNGFFFSVLGAIVLLFVYRMLRGRNA